MNQIPLILSAGTRKGDMPYRTLGPTGERVSAIGLGGFHIAQPGLSENESIRLVRAAVDLGITFMITVGTITKAKVSCGWERP